MNEDVDKDAQEVVNAWGLNVRAGNAHLLTEEFRALLELVVRYQESKKVADSLRHFDSLTDDVSSAEVAAREEFVEAHRIWVEKHLST